MKKGLITLLLLPAILVAGCASNGASQHASTGGSGTIDVPGYSVDQNAQQSKDS